MVVKSSCRIESVQLGIVIDHVLVANRDDNVALAYSVRAALGRIHVTHENRIDLGLERKESDIATDLAGQKATYVRARAIRSDGSSSYHGSGSSHEENPVHDHDCWSLVQDVGARRREWQRRREKRSQVRSSWLMGRTMVMRCCQNE